MVTGGLCSPLSRPVLSLLLQLQLLPATLGTQRVPLHLREGKGPEALALLSWILRLWDDGAQQWGSPAAAAAALENEQAHLAHALRAHTSGGSSACVSFASGAAA